MIKLHRILSVITLFTISIAAWAGWQVASPTASTPREPFFQANAQHAPVVVPTYAPVFPRQFAAIGPPAYLYAVSISGSLKENLERIMNRYHWHVVWKAPYDYNFDGRVTGTSLPNVVQKLLQPFPLQAVMYMSNRTVAIVPRLQL